MEFTEVITTRRSVRNYSEAPVEEEKISKIIEAAKMAPSWANRQCVNYIVVKDKNIIAELGGLYNRWLKNAPIVFVACADPKDSGSHNNMDYYLVDVGISLHQLILAATDLGLGTCWVGGFDENKVKKLLAVPKEIKVVALTPVGYPANESLSGQIIKKFIGSEKRKPIEELVHLNRW